MRDHPLTTARLSLSPLGPGDRDAFVAYRRDPAVARLQSWTPDYGTAEADRLIAAQPDGPLPAPGGWLQLAVRDPATSALLGDVAVHTWDSQPDTYELGVTVAPARQRAGVGREAVRRVADWLFDDHGAHRLVALCDARNEAVARLLRASGFRHEGRNVAADFFKGEWTSLDTYALLADERGAGR
ncbi:GNAT family N-acetyltransferase [Streptomyces avicenniae]|uniref:GNAT family N-acetyltransferase n=1 Tax=Streptomyces avicenniae TaxID=500153 RepID=UPI00069A0B89|nr:GNAT family protein [Streptomyces avicenniae]